MKRILTALLTFTFLLPLNAKAAVNAPAVGLPGPMAQNEIELQELRVTYRFDQINEPGKNAGMIPVQITARLHNHGNTQTLDVAIPLETKDAIAPKILSVFINGQEVPVKRINNADVFNYADDIGAAVFTITVGKDSDAILDVRLQQPMEINKLPIILDSAKGWQGMIVNGTVEAITPFMPANWNLEMRMIESDALINLTYADKSASYAFQNLEPSAAQNVYWHFADMEALEYFARGNERFQKTEGDAKSYEMMRIGLLDMIPCNGTAMPLKSWWNNMYETITMGVIAAEPEGQQRFVKAMELWSDNWSIPQQNTAECLALKQRQDKYKAALDALLAIPAAERSTVANDALKKNDAFLRGLSKVAGDGSVAQSESEILADDENASDKDKLILGAWDSRFTPRNGAQAPQAGNGTSANGGESIASSVWAKIKSAFPDISLWSQIVLFIILAIILAIIIFLLVFKWRDKQNPAKTEYPQQTAMKKPISPSFLETQRENDKNKSDGANSEKPFTPVQQTPVYPPPPIQPRKPDSFKPEAQKTDAPKDSAPTQKPQEPRKPLLDESYTDKKEPQKPASDPPWLKKDTTQELIKPTAPPPKPPPKNLPWQKKNEDNEQPPEPTVNI